MEYNRFSHESAIAQQIKIQEKNSLKTMEKRAEKELEKHFLEE